MAHFRSLRSVASPLASLALLVGMAVQGTPGVAQAADLTDYTVKISSPNTSVPFGDRVVFDIDVSRKTATGGDGSLNVKINPAFTNVQASGCSSLVQNQSVSCHLSESATSNGRHVKLHLEMTAPKTVGTYGIFAQFTPQYATELTDLDNFDAKQVQVLPPIVPEVVQSPPIKNNALRNCKLLGC